MSFITCYIAELLYMRAATVFGIALVLTLTALFVYGVYVLYELSVALSESAQYALWQTHKRAIVRLAVVSILLALAVVILPTSSELATLRSLCEAAR